MRKSKGKIFVRAAVAAVAVLATLFTTPGVAEAVTVRPGARDFQVDVLLDDYETEQARRSYWAATVICWNAGQQGYMLLAGTCQSMATVCAAQAYYATPRKRAGITFSPGGSWCWKY
jgi:hypothetical protein